MSFINKAFSESYLVIGDGAFGSALAMQLAVRNQQVTCVDQNRSAKKRYGSKGDERVTRTFSFEDVPNDVAPEDIDVKNLNLVASAQETIKGYRALEKEFPEVGEIVDQNETLIVGRTDGSGRAAHNIQDAMKRTIEVAKASGLEHRIMNVQEMHEEWPSFEFEEGVEGLRDPQGGMLLAQRAMQAHRLKAVKHGAKFEERKVKSIARKDKMSVVTFEDGSTVSVDKVIVAAGGWMPKFMPKELSKLFEVQAQVYGLYATEDPKLNHKNYPTLVNLDADPLYYGMVTHHGYPAKWAGEIGHVVKSPDENVPLSFIRQRLKDLDRALKNIKGLGKRTDMGVCYYTNTPDGQFIIDKHPEMEGVYFVSACSGHGFKHALALMGALADKMTGTNVFSKINLKAFTLKRPTLQQALQQ